MCTHECACVPIHSTHILYPPLMLLHLVQYTCTQILPLTILIQFTLRPPTHIISHKSHTHTHTHTHAHLHTHTHAHTHTHTDMTPTPTHPQQTHMLHKLCDIAYLSVLAGFLCKCLLPTDQHCLVCIYGWDSITEVCNRRGREGRGGEGREVMFSLGCTLVCCVPFTGI